MQRLVGSMYRGEDHYLLTIFSFEMQRKRNKLCPVSVLQHDARVRFSANRPRPVKQLSQVYWEFRECCATASVMRVIPQGILQIFNARDKRIETLAPRNAELSLLSCRIFGGSQIHVFHKMLQAEEFRVRFVQRASRAFSLLYAQSKTQKSQLGMKIGGVRGWKQNIKGFVVLTPSSAFNRRKFDKDQHIMRYSSGASVLCKVKSKLSCARELVFSNEGINANEFQILPPNIVVINCDDYKSMFQR